MKTKIGVAALLGLMLAGALTTSVQAQCGTGPMIILNTNSFAYEQPTAVTSPYVSPAGNMLTAVGLIQKFCAPFLDLNAASADTEYTIVLDGLTSLGTVPHVIGSTLIDVTDYSGGTFRIYMDGPPKNAPQSAGAMPGSPPNAVVPGNYEDGTLILSGTLSGFEVTVSKTGAGNPNGSYRSNATFTGGTLGSRLSTAGATLLQGNWCVFGCLPSSGGYSAQIDGKFDTPSTPTRGGTWGSLKVHYR